MKIQVTWVTCTPSNSPQLLTTHLFPRWKGDEVFASPASLSLKHWCWGTESWVPQAMILLPCSPSTQQWDACREEAFPLPHHLNCINCNFSKSSKELIKFWFTNYFSIWLELAANHLWKRKVNLSLTFANRDFSVKKLILCITPSWLFFFIFQCF